MSLFTQDQQWTMMDSYFKSHTYPFTKHHIDSYREFLRNYIPATIRTFNPITMIKLDTAGNKILSVNIFVGGKTSEGIYIDRPTMIDNNNKEVLLTPAEARLRNLTYEGHLYADIEVQYELADVEKDKAIQTTRFQKVLLGAIPLMVHSDACILNGQGPDVLRELGECIYDSGGYFIIDGKEKVIVSQERIANNKLFIEPIKDDISFSHRAYIKCVGTTGESKLAPKGFEFYVAHDMKIKKTEKEQKDEKEDKDEKEEEKETVKLQKRYVNNALYISFPALRGKVPLFLLFRALGLETDKEIVETIFGTSDVPNEYIKYIEASIRASHNYYSSDGISYTCFTQEEALDILQYRVQYQLIEYVKNILVTDVFPNVEDHKNKPIYLGFLVKQLLDVCLGIHPPTDRDAYITKRIDISGFQLAELFQETYMILRKNCRDLLDREYNLGPWRNNNNARITTLVRKDNIYKLFPPAIITDRFVRSLKGMWGSTDEDPEQGKVQDVSRISYLGYLSHMRRINLPLDRSRRNVPPHRLHSQQWGMFCPFETPDGQSIGLLKNFSMMANITFGTKIETIQEYLPRFGIIPLFETTSYNITNRDICKVLLNGTWYGISHDPVYHSRLLKALRRNGYINPFVSISWNIRENTLHIQTDPGRVCRPLLIVKGGTIQFPTLRERDKQYNWFYYLFGDGKSYLPPSHKAIEPIYYTEEMYYKDLFILPSWWSDPSTVEERITVITRLEKSQGCIEFLDVDEENTSMIAMSAADLASSDIRANQYTHCEIHPSAAFSVVTNTIPFANHNYAARNLFHGAQAKQTIGVYATNFRKRFDTMAYVMHYPQKPLVTTKTAHYIASNKMPNGFNAIVAIATNTGYNQEDGVIINKSAIDRGLFQSTAFKTMTASEKVISPFERLQFRNPFTPVDILSNFDIPEDIIEVLKTAGYITVEDIHKTNDKKFIVEGLTEETRKKILEKVKEIKELKKDPNIEGVKSSGYYQLLDENGIIREGSKISRGFKMVVMSMVHVREEHREVTRGILSEIEKIKHYRDTSYMTDVHHYGIVDKVFLGTKALGSSDRICKVRFRKNRRPELGDKFSSRHGQKGVIGMILPERDMPMTKDGIIPDIIINPHALPSRMTIAHLVECIFSKTCCFDGLQGDATMFIPVSYDAIGAPLEQQGFDKYGNEIMYDGRTGRQIATDIFIGPTFYYRLKHMVSDKVHGRGGNPPGLPRPDLPLDQLTRQPTEGRAKNGGLRVGEMERDVILSYGMAQFSKESVMERSDKFRYDVCRHCGLVASPLEYGSKLTTCLHCKRSDMATVETPYAWKLLTQEFEVMGIQMRFVTDPIEHSLSEDEEDEAGSNADQEDIPEDFELEAEALPEDELGGDYDHNQDLNEPELHGMIVGGMTPDITDATTSQVIDTETGKEPDISLVSASPTPVVPSVAEKSPEPPTTLSEPPIKSETSSTSLQQSPQLGGNMILDLDADGGSIDLNNLSSSTSPQFSSPQTEALSTQSFSPLSLPQSEIFQKQQQGGEMARIEKPQIKVIEIKSSPNTIRYKPPRSGGDEYSGGNEDGGGELESDDFFS